MLQLNLNQLTPSDFLSIYWQKKPLVIRQGFKDFQDFLSSDELAGLACDDYVESRIVSQKNNLWHAEFGPFENYEHLGEKDWSLIVQAVNNWVPEVSQLIECFDFIPRWRFDDVMVSYATPGGGVGPHIDLYDVFICQGSGRRRWYVGDKGDHKEFAAHEALLHTESFESIIDVELFPGDILYIPPGFPHEGITLEESMSFSVGYRTSSAKDMISELADHLIDTNAAPQQIRDPDRQLSSGSGLINASDFVRIKQQIFNTLDDTLISEFSGCYLTRSKCELDLPDVPFEFDLDYLLVNIKEQNLTRLGGLRCLYFEESVSEGIFYLNGEKINLDEKYAQFIPLLCNNQVLTFEMLKPLLKHHDLIESLLCWLNLGYWYFDE
ncbi:cupin domain-containing protein [Pseudoalteromonas sp. C2R02]|uniref:ribosomal protein uL16 3-hydroxylase n=1 Tax=Pseudoalteromonas sp. C2R02 TaxID=2841565 RepID=UPI001C09B7BA|nr:cupin domain-containing protein [Pseudoalteromonas sp. C2R02]MBU2969533.1 cupin domain-containing protein [Pseudoalteromonas sp. C2R02]